MLTFSQIPQHIKATLPPEAIFEKMHGEVIKAYYSKASDDKEYSILECTKRPVINLPRPSTIEEFDRYYIPSLMSILNRMLDK